MRARSTAASVCPARTRTPPFRAFSGNMWPGRARSDGRVLGSIAASTVAARSPAEMPVLVTPFASIGTQNAVSNRAVFCGDHLRAGPARRAALRVIGMQIRPRPYFAMKLIASGVIFSAAMVRSPSFSRSSSSMTMIIWPLRMAVDRVLDRRERRLLPASRFVFAMRCRPAFSGSCAASASCPPVPRRAPRTCRGCRLRY